MTVKYLAFVLDKGTRDRLLALFPKTFENVRCHHITLSDDISDLSSAEVAAKIDAIDGSFYAWIHFMGEHIHAVGVKYRTMGVRLPRAFPHVTISYEPPARSKDSIRFNIPEGVDYMPSLMEDIESFKLTGSFEVLERNND